LQSGILSKPKAKSPKPKTFFGTLYFITGTVRKFIPLQILKKALSFGLFALGFQKKFWALGFGL
jgi:hypothetical protein